MYPEKQRYVYTKTCTLMFIAASFLIAQTRNNADILKGEWMVIYTVVLYMHGIQLSNEKGVVCINTSNKTGWISTIMLNEKSQLQNHILFHFIYIHLKNDNKAGHSVACL